MIKICKLIKLTAYIVLFLIATGAFGQTATHLVISAPGNAITAGTNFSVTVRAVHSGSTTDGTATPQVTLSLRSGTTSILSSGGNTAGLTVPLSSGTHTWNDLQIDRAGTVRMLATDNADPPLARATTDLSIIAAPVVATELAITVPTESVVVNTNFSVTVRAVGSDGATATTGTIQVRLSLAPGTGTSPGTGALTSSGVAAGLTVTLDGTYTHTWNDLQYNTEETIRIRAADANGGFMTGLATATSGDIVVGPAPVVATTFAIVEPTDAVVVGTDFSVTVRAVDGSGATATTGSIEVRLGLATGATGALTSAGGSPLTVTLDGTYTHTWNDLQIDVVGNIKDYCH